jgi:DUF2075 family protein
VVRVPDIRVIGRVLLIMGFSFNYLGLIYIREGVFRD